MKFLFPAAIFLGFAAQLTSGCHSCDCYKCGSLTTLANGDLEVTIDSSECKNTAISWICCTAVDGDSAASCPVTCNSGSQDGSRPKCQDVDSGGFMMTLPAGSTSFTINTHDGQTANPLSHVNDIGICGGPTDALQQGSCDSGAALPVLQLSVATSYCLIDIDLSTCPADPEMSADPHMKSFKGEWFDYMGECDLKLLHAPKFDGVLDMDIHVRTTITFDYSYIEAAALRIGEDILEVGAWGDYALNGVEGAMRTGGMVPKVGGHQVHYTQVSKKKHVYEVVIDDHHNVTLSSFKDWVNVKLVNADETHYGDVSGMLGDFHGKMLSRDRKNLHDDINALGQDWQIIPEDGDFFRSARAPQYPEACRLPDPKMANKRRRLGQGGVSKEAAMEACAQVKGTARINCVMDVVSTGDLEMAQSGQY